MKLISEMSQEEVLRVFYLCGAISFLIIGIFNIWTNSINWEFMLLSLKVSSVMSNFFNFVVSWFFYSMYLNNKKQNKGLNPLEEKDAEEILRGIESGN